MSWRKEYFKRLEIDGEVHVSGAPQQEALTLCCINDFSRPEMATMKAVTCIECRGIANYCQDHVRLRPAKKRRASQIPSHHGVSYDT